LTAFAAALPILVIYCIFFASQGKVYLSAFSGVLPQNFSYAEYAREGFFQLCSVSIINLIIIVAVITFMKKKTKAASVLLKIVSLIFSVFTLVLIATAIAKLVMYAILRALNKKDSSDILKLMSLDCVLDFFITSVTVMTLLISTYGNYAADAFCGIIISIIITVSAIKSILANCRKLIGYLPTKERDILLSKLYEIIDEKDISHISFHIGDNLSEAFVYTAVYKAVPEGSLEALSKQTGITVYIIPRKENTVNPV
jgi:hypothetical protein